jgi:signal peptidase I
VDPSAQTDVSIDAESDDPWHDDTLEERKAAQKKAAWLTALEWGILIISALGIALLIKTFLFQAFYIPSESMVPTLEKNDRVLVNKLSYVFGEIHHGNVVVFSNPHPPATPERGTVGAFVHWLGEGLGFAQPPDEDLIKRVIGLPGDTVAIRDNVVYVNGRRLSERYLPPGAQACNGSYPTRTVPVGRVWVLGDNRCNSGDSRFGLGMVPESDVIGRAFVIIWPVSDAGGL